MATNITKFEDDYNVLMEQSQDLLFALQFKCYPKELRKELGDEADVFLKKLPSFSEDYQSWYSESQALIKQLLPDRLEDFCKHYQKPKSRKDISFENYRIEDCLQGLIIKNGFDETIVDSSAAIPHFEQQIAILKSVGRRFESSLFDIQQLVMADLFDSELAAAQELLKKGFHRASGAVAGVVIEKHLSQVCLNHGIKSRKKNPSISDFNDLLKSGAVIDTPVWRNIQQLGDIRNLCDHNKDRDPTIDEVDELVRGAGKLTKTLF